MVKVPVRRPPAESAAGSAIGWYCRNGIPSNRTGIVTPDPDDEPIAAGSPFTVTDEGDAPAGSITKRSLVVPTSPPTPFNVSVPPSSAPEPGAPKRRRTRAGGGAGRAEEKRQRLGGCRLHFERDRTAAIDVDRHAISGLPAPLARFADQAAVEREEFSQQKAGARLE